MSRAGIKPDDPNRWMNTDEIALLTGYAVEVIRQKVREGEIPARKFGKHNKVLRKDYETWVNTLPAASPLSTPSRASA